MQIDSYRKFNKMNSILKIEKRASLLMTLFAIICVFGDSLMAQECDYVTGPVRLNVSGGNNTADYTTKFILTDVKGVISDVQDSSKFDILQEGFYIAYAVNYKNNSTVTGLSKGEFIQNLIGDCLDLSPPFGFTACSDIDKCEYCLGETVTLNASGGNNTGVFKTKYLLADKKGKILGVFNTPVFQNLGVGLYLAFPINYDSTKTITGIDTGKYVVDIQSTCKDIGKPYVITICDKLKPTIFFDLNACNITSTAILQVGGVYNSYKWSTGSTSDFIVVSAITPGTYRVTVTLSTGCIGVAEQKITGKEISTIGDFVWEDRNVNGIQDSLELGINNVRVNLYADFDKNGKPDFPNFPACTTLTKNHPQTGAPGYYIFNVYRANYIVEFINPSGFTFSIAGQGSDRLKDSDPNPSTRLTGSIGILSDEHRRDIDAGLFSTVSICGQAWNDLDADGRREAGEPGIDNVMVDLFSAQGNMIASTLTGSVLDTVGGKYCFNNIPVGSYYIKIVLPNGYILTKALVAGDSTRDSDISGTNGPLTSKTINTTAGVVSNNIDIGLYVGGNICGIVWQDVTSGTENIYDEGKDSLVADAQVELISSPENVNIKTVSTDSKGQYCISGIPIGTYKVMFGTSQSLSFVVPNIGTNKLIDSDVDMNSGLTSALFVAPKDTIFGINAGIRFGTVPVELAYFNGFWDRNGDFNQLIWSTSSEIINDRFEIERAFGPNDKFTKIGEVRGKGTSLEAQYYQFEDYQISLKGDYYYRLKQVDYDGGFEYSDIITINIDRTKSRSSADIQIYPNPASTTVQISIPNVEEVTELFFMEISGKVLRSLKINKVDDLSDKIKIDISQWPNGSYILLVKMKSGVMSKNLQIAR